MPRLYEYSEALTRMREKRVYAIAAPDGENNEVFFIGRNGALQTCKPIPAYPTTVFANDSPYTVAQLEASGWILPNYCDHTDDDFRFFLGNVGTKIAALEGILAAIQSKANDCDLREFFKTAQKLLTETLDLVGGMQRMKFDAKPQENKD